jgi:hypothetical protein
MDYWVYQLTGLESDEWRRRAGGAMDVFKQMHETVEDYAPLIELIGDEKLTTSSKAIELEMMIDKIADHLGI